MAGTEENATSACVGSTATEEKKDVDHEDSNENEDELEKTMNKSKTENDVQELANRLYRGLTLAPMVRASTTPLRVLSLKYGANAVYSEELVDRSLSSTIRVVNPLLGTIDYVKDPKLLSAKTRKKLQRESNRPCLIFRIDPKIERQKLICQLGTGEPELAVPAALHVYQDVAAIDINMGCPKKFSVSGGMGSALLDDPNRASTIIKTLRRNIPSRPISCKIRLKKTVAETIDFIEGMILAGVNALAIHARRVGHDATVSADWDTMKEVMKILRPKYPTFPFLLNGDFYDPGERQEIIDETHANGFLLGRPALYNTSTFRVPFIASTKYNIDNHYNTSDNNVVQNYSSTSVQEQRQQSNDPTTPSEQEDATTGNNNNNPMSLYSKTKVIQDYIMTCGRYDVHYKNAKYVICEMMNNRRTPYERVPYMPQTFENGQTIAKTCSCTSLQQMCQLWNVDWNLTKPPTTATTISSTTTSLAAGEHRYEDWYFLKHESKNKNNDANSSAINSNKDDDNNNRNMSSDKKHHQQQEGQEQHTMNKKPKLC